MALRAACRVLAIQNHPPGQLAGTLCGLSILCTVSALDMHTPAGHKRVCLDLQPKAPMPKTDADVLATHEKGALKSVATQLDRTHRRSQAAAQADLALYRKAAARLADKSASVLVELDQL